MNEALTDAVRLNSQVVASNRLSLAPMTNCLSNSDGTVSDEEILWLGSRAASGFGTVVTSGLAINDQGRSWDGQAGLHREHYLGGLQRLRQACGDSVALAQLFHGGLRSPSHLVPGGPVGPSPGAGVRALTTSEVYNTIHDFTTAALRAVEAGFDGVEIHSAHGYLPAQFLSGIENQRTDEFGGDIRGRSRFTLELVQRLRSELPANAVIQLRLSAEDMRQSRGIDLDETLWVAQHAVALGADTISLSVWDINPPSQKYPDVTPTTYIRERLNPSTPLTVAGKIWTNSDALNALDQGADQVAIGRMAIFNRNAAEQIINADWIPQKPPFTLKQFAEEVVPPAFINYMRGKWGYFIADGE